MYESIVQEVFGAGLVYATQDNIMFSLATIFSFFIFSTHVLCLKDQFHSISVIQS